MQYAICLGLNIESWLSIDAYPACMPFDCMLIHVENIKWSALNTQSR